MSKPKILYIEDNDDNYRLVARVLLRLDFIVERAKTAEAAIEMIQNDCYAMVITDILLPDNTIDEAQGNLLQPIRALIGPEVPLIALTAHAFHFDEDFLLASGCDYFIAKPLNITEFQDLVLQLLDK